VRLKSSLTFPAWGVVFPCMTTQDDDSFIASPTWTGMTCAGALDDRGFAVTAPLLDASEVRRPGRAVRRREVPLDGRTWRATGSATARYRYDWSTGFPN